MTAILVQNLPRRLALLGLFLALWCGLPATLRAGQGADIQRYALLIGSNNGGEGRVTLQYAESDARAMGTVLEQLGGVTPDRRVLLMDPTRSELNSSILRLGDRMSHKTSGQRVELLFYYSGHSDELGLLLRGELLTYEDLRQSLARLPADVRIAILDSCASGAMTRRKGGTFKAPFLFDSSVKVQGYAYLTSSSADEAAQESDRIGGSFFTHYLISGMRGAADVTGDQRVTLNEVYQFAFHETLARTQQTRTGPQHPAYDIQLAGTGDLVMTDLRAANATLVLAPDLEGRIYLYDEAQHLAAELLKAPGRSVELGLAPGRYSVVVIHQKTRFKGELNLAADGRTELNLHQLQEAPGEYTTLRGDDEPGDGAPTTALTPTQPPPQGELRHVPLGLSLAPGLGVAGNTEDTIQHFSLGLTVGTAGEVQGLALANIGHVSRRGIHGAQVSGVFNVAGGDVYGLQVAGGVNAGKGKLEGIQVAGGLNTAASDVRVAQIAGGMNVAGANVEGIQTSGGINVARGDVTGIQSTGGANLAWGVMTGVQAAGGFNFAGQALWGLQSAGGVNVARGEVNGIQLAGGVNVADQTLHGLMVSGGANIADGGVDGLMVTGGLNVARDPLQGAQIGVVNVGTTVHGAQIGVINIAREVEGAQIGVINVAQKVEGVPLGVVSWVTEGEHHLDVYWNDFTTANVALKLGNDRVYSLLGVGASPELSPDRYSVTAGLGLIVGGDPFFANIDITTDAAGQITSPCCQSITSLHRLRLQLGLDLGSHLAILGGPSVNVMISYPGGEDPSTLVRQNVPQFTVKGDNTTVTIYPGFSVGVQL